jgi:mRNA deadenylase 3'-5' endonuclease subunit Ccr4
MSKESAMSLEEWEPINERLITSTLNSMYKKITVIQCFALTIEAYRRTQRKNFMNNSKQQRKRSKSRTSAAIMGDFNAKVGSDNSAFQGTMGRHGLGERNDHGLKLVEFCSENRTGMIISAQDHTHRLPPIPIPTTNY